jgi:hypothetical protein
VTTRSELSQAWPQIAHQRVVVVCGLPATGKTTLLRRFAADSARRDLEVASIEWDATRLRVESRLADAPNTDPGQASTTVRRIASTWARTAIATWSQRAEQRGRLLVEAPLIGHRFATLAAPSRDAAEAALAEATFVVPVPTEAVRARFLDERRAAHAAPHNAVVDAPVDVVNSVWQDLRAAAAALGIADSPAYSPRLYEAVFLHVLRRRERLAIDVPYDVISPRDLPTPAYRSIVPANETIDALVHRNECFDREWFAT